MVIIESTPHNLPEHLHLSQLLLLYLGDVPIITLLHIPEIELDALHIIYLYWGDYLLVQYLLSFQSPEPSVSEDFFYPGQTAQTDLEVLLEEPSDETLALVGEINVSGECDLLSEG